VVAALFLGGTAGGEGTALHKDAALSQSPQRSSIISVGFDVV
jgi:hypothetical protein